MEGRETAPTNFIDIHSHGKLRMTIDEIGGEMAKVVRAIAEDGLGSWRETE